MPMGNQVYSAGYIDKLFYINELHKNLPREDDSEHFRNYSKLTDLKLELTGIIVRIGTRQLCEITMMSEVA